MQHLDSRLPVVIVDKIARLVHEMGLVNVFEQLHDDGVFSSTRLTTPIRRINVRRSCSMAISYQYYFVGEHWIHRCYVVESIRE